MSENTCPLCLKDLGEDADGITWDTHFEIMHQEIGLPEDQHHYRSTEGGVFCSCGQVFPGWTDRGKHLKRAYRGIEPDHSQHATMEALRRL